MPAERSHRPAAGAPRYVAGPWWALGLAALLGALVLRLGGAASPLAGVVAAVTGPRLVEGRLSGGFPYAPLATATLDARPSAPAWRVLEAAARAEEASAAAPTAANLQALGVAALQAANLEAAVQALEDAATADATNPAIQSDLAAAYLARSGLPGRAIDLPRALEAADRAQRLNPRLIAAVFNRALILERLSLRREAARAWDAYLAFSADEPGWGDEARRRRVALDVEPAREPLSPAAEAEARLSDWARVALVEPAEARFPDLTRYGAFYGAIADTARRANAAARRALAENLRDILAAEVALVAPNYGVADQLAAGVEARAPDPDSPLHLWAVRLRLTTGFNTGVGRDQRRIAEHVAAAAERRGFVALVSDARHRLGALDYVSGRYERAYEHYAEALRLRESLGNVRAAVSSRMAAADALRMLGREPEAWERYVANLRAGALGEASLENVRLTGPAQGSLAVGRPAVALAFAREAVLRALATGQVGLLANARQLEARALWRLGEPAAAADALRRGREALDADKDLLIRDRYLAEFALTSAELLSTSDPEAAVAAIADTERRLRSNVGQRLVELSVLEARVQRRRGNVDGARDALRKGVALVEAQQDQIGQADFLPSFLDASWDVFSEFVDLEAGAGRHADALQWLDRGFDIRRRWAGRAPASALADISRDGPLVTYLSRSNGLWIWVVNDGAVWSQHVAVTGEALARKVARLSHMLTLDAAPEAVEEAVRALARDVWWPIAGRLAPGGVTSSRIALVPDPVLQRVPFALLPWSAADPGPVVDRTATVLCPSLLACRTVGAALDPGARVTALHAGQGGAGFAGLPAAREEAERIGRRYAGARVAPATEAAFASALASADVLHFSGHAVPDERYPGRSELLLATDAGDAVRVPLGRLFAGGVRTGLVVLSACRTSRAEARRGEGGIGVAGEFLRAGVRQVLAAQWDVKDDVAGDVMDLVHDALAAGATPWDAVRYAQRVMRRDHTRRARDWAGYVAYTSVSDS